MNKIARMKKAAIKKMSTNMKMIKPVVKTKTIRNKTTIVMKKNKILMLIKVTSYRTGT